MTYIIITGLVIIYIGYAVLPNFIFRSREREIPHYLKRDIYRKVDERKCIALTFDDGPDPRYTGRVLDILKANDVKATFFVVATRVLKSPELVQRMVNEGHEVGLHSYDHKSAWLIGPVKTIKSYEKAIAVLENYVPKVRWSRPPWGTFNLLTLYGAKRKGLKSILWSVNAADWRIKSKPDIIIKRILERCHEGAVIVLHDAGGDEGAPENTVAALDGLIKQLKKEYEFISLKEGLCDDQEYCKEAINIH